jgi:malate synthase
MASNPIDPRYVRAGGLQVDAELYEFVGTQVLPGLDLTTETVWAGLRQLVTATAPQIAQALATRADLQAQINDWHRRRGEPHDPLAYRAFLESIGYIVPPGEDFEVETDHVDAEISQIAGPQLVVPVSNARYSLNAANARWGSLYDAIYGTDVLEPTHPPAAMTPPAAPKWSRGSAASLTTSSRSSAARTPTGSAPAGHSQWSARTAPQGLLPQTPCLATRANPTRRKACC